MKKTIIIIIFIIFLTSIITILNTNISMAKYALSQTSSINAEILIDLKSPIIELTDSKGNVIDNENNKTTYCVTVKNIYDDLSNVKESTYKYSQDSKNFEDCNTNTMEIGTKFEKPGYYEVIAIDNAGNVTFIYFQILYSDITYFITEWTITADNTTIILPIIEEPNITVDWGDGVVELITTVEPTHTYSAGVYLIKISGNLPYWNFKSVRNSRRYISGIKQWGEVNLESMENAFYYCTNLIGNIPEPTERSFKNVKSFEWAFYACSRLTGNIPPNLFINCPNVTSFRGTFFYCDGLTGKIPSQLFSNCTNASNFSFTFMHCIGLSGEIPEELFANCPNATNFERTFNEASGLTGQIPENLFSNCTKITNFSGTFYKCSNLSGKIPENLFANCPKANTFINTFNDCYNLTGEIPTKLFANCPDVTNFDNTFYNCRGLTGKVSEELFSNCPNATSFFYTFCYCSNITSASINIKNIDYHMFSQCSSLKDITIGDNVSSISSDAFWLSNNILETTLRTNNQLALDYDWSNCNRKIVNTFNI